MTQLDTGLECPRGRMKCSEGMEARRQEREVEVAEFCRAIQAGFRGLGGTGELVRFKPGTTSASVCLKKVTLSLCGEQLGLRVKE